MVDLDAVVRLERAFLDTWCALEAETLGSWVLSASHGVTGRANSVTVLAADDADEAQVVAAEDWYRLRGLPPTFRVTPLSGRLVETLAGRGYEPWNQGCDVLALSMASSGRAVDAVATDVEIAASPGPDWFEVADRPPHDRPVLTAMFDLVDGPRAFASIREQGRRVAVGQAAVTGDVAMVYGMATRPSHRGRGLARSILDALETWARGAGAVTVALQVTYENGAAQHLYRSRGYAPVYRYDYLRLPA